MTGIVFAPYITTSYEGGFDARLPRVAGRFAAGDGTSLNAVIPYLVGEFVGETTMPPPSLVGFTAILNSPYGEFRGSYVAAGSLDAVLPGFVGDFYSGTRMRATLPRLYGRFSTGFPAFIAVNLPLEVFFSTQFSAPVITDEVLMLTERDSQWAIIIESIANLTTVPSVLANLLATLESSIVAHSTFNVVFLARLEDAAEFGDDPASLLRMVYLLAEELAVQDESVGFYSALVTVASAVLLADTITPGLDGWVESAMELSEEVSSHVRAIVELLAEVELEAQVESQLLLFALVESSLALIEDPAALVSMLVELMDTVGLGVHLTTEAGDSFIGYTVNTRTAAVSQYENYPFNSFAIVGGLPYGAGADGIYRLGGDTDDGAPIHASFYTGLTDFGVSYLKRVPAAWIGLTSDGEMVLKVVTTDKGRKKENWYRMKARPQGAPVDSRFSPAKGLEGRYWGFKLENIDGAYFQLDSLKVWPLVMNRRYSGR